MLKQTLIALMIIVPFLSANEIVEEGSTDIQIVNPCDKVYDDCALQCEKSKETDIAECYAKCEALYDKCEQKLINEGKTLESN